MVDGAPTPSASDRSSDRVGVLVGGGLATLTFVGLLVVAGVSLYHQIQTVSSWRQVEGVVVESRVAGDVEVQTAEVGPTLSTGVVKYEYMVVGQFHASDRVTPYHTRSSDDSHAKALVARYPEGRKVIVHYDPDDPSDALLEPEVAALSVLLFLLGLVGTCAACVLWRRCLR